ncbi:MAG: hypothetical protein ACPGLY_05140 [Rubripirellula sp.]
MRNQNTLSHIHLIQRFECVTQQGFSGFALLRFECKTFGQLLVEFSDLTSDRFRKRLLARTGKHEGVETLSPTNHHTKPSLHWHLTVFKGLHADPHQ